MEKLDSLAHVKKYDPDRNLESVGMLGAQINQVWQEFKKVSLPADYKNITKIVLNGMGGSQLGLDMLRSVYLAELKVPIELINGYSVPAHIDKNTLYIIVSYSGGTEEPISTLDQAKKQGAKLFAIASGDKLAQLIKQGKIPGYVFDPINNPSNQPRIGLGYTAVAELALLKKLGLIKVSDEDIAGIIKNLALLDKNFGFASKLSANPAKTLAKQLAGKAVLVAASEHLAGNAHIFANQINETSKTLATYFLIPELNHHLLEALKFPTTNQAKLMFFFIESDLYHTRNQYRHAITQKIVAKNKIKFTKYKLKSKDKLSQAFEVLFLGSYISFYLAMLNNVNPNLIPYVIFFKDELKKKN